MNDAHEQKQALRRELRMRRRALDPAWVADASARIQEFVLALDEFLRARAVACYLAMPHEVQTSRLLQACWSGSRRVAVPVFDERPGVYTWSWYEPRDEARPRRWPVAEPIQIRRAAPSDLDVILVPAVAVDRSGRRLGHGGGHYDRLLAKTRAPRVALVFGFQVVEVVPAGPHDCLMDVIVTETGVTRIPGRSERLPKQETRSDPKPERPPPGGQEV